MDIGDHLALVIRSHIVDLVADVHVPVYAFRRAGRGISAAGLDQHANLTQGVLLIAAVVREDFQLAAVKLLRPVALFAGFLRRS